MRYAARTFGGTGGGVVSADESAEGRDSSTTTSWGSGRLVDERLARAVCLWDGTFSFRVCVAPGTIGVRC